MRILTRYLLRSHVGPFLFAFAALLAIVLTNVVAEELAGLAGKGLPARVFVEFFVLSLPSNVAVTLPMSVLVSVLYTFSRLAEEREIAALQASGIDLRRLVLPLLLCAGGIAVGMVWFNDRVLPAANYRWKMLMVDVAYASPLLAVREQVMNPIESASGSTTHYLRASRVEAGTGRMRDVAIFDVSRPEVSRTVLADSGTMALSESGTDLALTLFDGHVREVDLADPQGFQQVAFDRQVMRLEGVVQRMTRSTETIRDDREMTMSMMAARVDTFRAEIVALRRQVGERPSAAAGDAAHQEALIESLRFRVRELQVEIQKKLAIPAATLVFVLIGVPLALRFPNGGAGMVMAASLTIFSVFYAGLKLGEQLANEGYISPFVGMWTTNLVFGALGAAAMLRVGHERGSGRGGSGDEWLSRLRRARLPVRRATG